MKKCGKCGCDLEDDAKFCKYCGAEYSETTKKLNYIGRREARAREQQMLMDKSFIHDEQLSGRDTLELDKISVRPIGDAKKIVVKNALYISAMAIFIVIALAVFFVFKYMEGWARTKLLVTLVLFMGSAFAAAIILERSYYLRMLKKMRNSKSAIKKITYGKPPQLFYDGNLYELNIKDSCPTCIVPTAMHIEEVNGSFVAVCNSNREHIFLIDTKMLIECFDPSTGKIDTLKAKENYAKRKEETAENAETAETVVAETVENAETAEIVKTAVAETASEDILSTAQNDDEVLNNGQLADSEKIEK